MKRRSALKSMSLAVAGFVSLPAWVSGWSPESLGGISTLPGTDADLLAEIVETIIPETTTPGAKSLQIHQFVMRMIRDCYGKAAQTSLEQGLVATEQIAQVAFNKPFRQCDVAQRTQVLTHLQTSEEGASRQFVDMIKNLTIRGYMNSEYVLVNLLDYKMAPGYYHGCVPVKT
jgi:hypothetical protein